jgi:hypothetical protein
MPKLLPNIFFWLKYNFSHSILKKMKKNKINSLILKLDFWITKKKVNVTKKNWIFFWYKKNWSFGPWFYFFLLNFGPHIIQGSFFMIGLFIYDWLLDHIECSCQ